VAVEAVVLTLGRLVLVALAVAVTVISEPHLIMAQVSQEPRIVAVAVVVLAVRTSAHLRVTPLVVVVLVVLVS